MLGLPEGVRACLFDLDGVLTQTAKVHAAARKEIFDWTDGNAKGETKCATTSAPPNVPN